MVMLTETPAGPRPRRVRRAAMLVALPSIVAAVVVGILGMHVLSGSHAMPPMAAGGATTHASMTTQVTGRPDSVPDASEANSLVFLATAGHEDSASSPSWGNSGADGHGIGSMMMLCVAMLLSAGAAVLALFALGRRHKMWAWLPSALTWQVPGPPADRIGTGPPTAWRFSVIRC